MYGDMEVNKFDNLMPVLVKGNLSHSDISLVCHECANDGDEFGAFVCLIMLQYSEPQLQKMFNNNWI